MDLGLNHTLKTEISQKMALSHEMIQSIEILQLNRGELYDYVYNMMLENPVIDMETPQDDWQDYPDISEYESESYYGNFSYSGNENMYRYEYDAACEVTLEENLINQVEFCDVPYLIKSIAVYIIQTLDDNGYMTRTVEKIADELCVRKADVQEALETVWSFDPAGVGARSLEECLKLQLSAMEKLNPVMSDIIDNHLEDIAMERFDSVASGAGISIGDAIRCGELIRSLDPKPGRMFASSDSTNYIIPDVIVEEENGSVSVRLKESASPKVIIRDEYRKLMDSPDGDESVRKFLTGRFESAKWIVNCIEQRKRTILSVAGAIVRHQRKFIVYGRKYLVPVTMKEIAEELGISESTVSRAVNGKYMQCPHGTVEMRQLFTGTSRFRGRDGQYASSEALKTMIETMVKLEDIRRPLSDKSIADAICVSGISISRRTVAKYREEMGIPSSSARKRKI